MGEYRAAVAGESFRNKDGTDRQVEIGKCRVGEAVILEREADNPHDNNCIRVISARGIQIGNVARDAAVWIAERLDSGHALSAKIDSIGLGEGRYFGVVLAVETDYHSAPARKPPRVAAAVTSIDPTTRRDFEVAPSKRKGRLWALVSVAAIAALAVVKAPTAKERAAEEKAAEKAAAGEVAKETPEAEERRRSGFDCLSHWDGSNRSLVSQVKSQLRDPDSFAHDETKITPRDAKGQHMATMRYRARNGFGGMNVAVALATIDGDTCNASLLTTGE